MPYFQSDQKRPEEFKSKKPFLTTFNGKHSKNHETVFNKTCCFIQVNVQVYLKKLKALPVKHFSPFLVLSLYSNLTIRLLYNFLMKSKPEAFLQHSTLNTWKNRYRNSLMEAFIGPYHGEFSLTFNYN